MRTINLKNNRKEYIVLSTILILIIALVLKNQYACRLFMKSSFGMQPLIEKGEIDTLYLGSSMFRQGLDIYEIEEDGQEAYILAYNGNQPITELFELEYLLEHDVIIHDLYVDMYGYSMTMEPSIFDDKLFLDTDIRGKQKLWSLISNHSLSDFWSMWVSSNNDHVLFWPITSKIISGQFYMGGSVNNTGHLREEDMKRLACPVQFGETNSRQKEALEGILSLCKNHDIQVTFVDTPKTQVVIEDKGYQRIMEEYEEILKEYKVKSIVQNRDYTFDVQEAEYFQDAIHLSSEGRREFSRMIKGL